MLAFVSMFFLGLGVTLVGATAQNVGIAPEQVGILITIQQLGFLSSVALAGSMADRKSKTAILTVGCVMVAVGIYCFFLWESFALNLLFMFLIGAGTGSFEGVTDALLVDAHRQRANLFITLNHFFVVFGALLITVYMYFLQLQWRAALLQAAVILVALAVLGILVKDPPVASAGGPDRRRILELFRNPTIILLFVAAACALGLEAGTIGILTSYLVELRGVDPAAAPLGLVLFLAAYGLGRAVLGPFIVQQRITRWLVILFAASTVTLLGMYALSLPWLLYVFIVLAGLTVTNLLPLLIALAGKAFPDAPATAMGILKLGIPVGGVVLPFLLSAVTTIMSLQVALYLFPVTALAGFLVTLRLDRRVPAA